MASSLQQIRQTAIQTHDLAPDRSIGGTIIDSYQIRQSLIQGHDSKVA